MWSYLFKERELVRQTQRNNAHATDFVTLYVGWGEGGWKRMQHWDRQGKRAVNEQDRKWPKAGPWDHPLLYQTFSLICKEIFHLLVQFYKLLPPMYPFQRQRDLYLFWMILYIKCEMVSLNLFLFHLLSISNWLKEKKTSRAWVKFGHLCLIQ